MSLKDKLISLLLDAKRMCSACSDAAALGKEIQQFEERIEKPLRVAIVGIMKAGKSTFMNSLMGENLLYTGIEETTYTVTWFKYSPKPYLNIVFKNMEGNIEKCPFEDLEKWTVRNMSVEMPRINDVKYIEVYYPNTMLKTIELIDTPGLNSAINLDAQNTMNFLGVKKAKELEKTTLDEASKADAIIYAYTRSAGSSDKDFLNDFHGNAITSSTSPINAVGVYTKSDQLWKVLKADTPLELGQNVADTTMKNPEMKKLLYSTLPVVAKIVEGFTILDESDWKVLESLSKIPFEVLKYEMRHVQNFTEKQVSEFDPEIQNFICTSLQRLTLIEKIGVYGICEITNCIIQKFNKQQIKEHIYKVSGIEKVNELVVNHFGNRAFLIKTQYILLRMKSICSQYQQQSNNTNLKIISNEILEKVNEIERSEHVFRELKVLQDYYNGLFYFNNNEEYQEFLQVTGEKGLNCEVKLGINSPTFVSEMARVAQTKAQEWNGKANEFGVSRLYEQAANVATRSYDNLYYHLNILSGE